MGIPTHAERMPMSGKPANWIRSNILGLIAIFIALSGSAIAANTVASTDIINGEVKAVDIGTGELTSTDLLNGTVNSQDLAGGAVAGPNILSGAVTSPKVANNSLTAADVANTHSLGPAEIGELGTAEIAEGAVTGADLAGTGIGDNGFNGDEEIIDGTISGFDIADDSLGSADVADDSLGGFDIQGLDGGSLVDASSTSPPGLRRAQIGAVTSFAAQFNPPSLAAGACTTVSTIVPGLQPNDLLVVNDSSGGNFAVWMPLLVSVADQADLYYCNQTTGTLNPPTSNMVIMAIR
jgi:hypothetical protein